MIHHATAENAEEIARLLRSRGRIVITDPPKSGKTTELIRYAEERYPNGRFAVVAQEKDHLFIIKLHWLIHNELTWADLVTKRLLGEKLEGEDVVEPMMFTPESVMVQTFNASTPTFVDDWHLLSEHARAIICKRRLFIAATCI